MMFYPGQPVICINDNFKWARKMYAELRSYPVRGSRYVVRQYVLRGGPYPTLVLNELINPVVVYQDGKLREAGFWEKRFVAVPLPDEITALLTRVNDKEEV